MNTMDVRPLAINMPWRLTLAFGYFLCGIGMTLPIEQQSVPPLIGFVTLTFFFFITSIQGRGNAILLAEQQTIKTHKIFFLSIALMIVAGLPGTLTSIHHAPEYGLRNIATLTRLGLYLALTTLSAAITRTSKFDLTTPILMGTAFASIWNFWDLFSGHATTNSLAGQNPLGYCLSVTLPLVANKIFSTRRSTQIFWGLVFLLLIGATILTWSKAAWINVAIVVMALAIIQIVKNKRYIATLTLITILITLYASLHESISWILETEISASEGSSSNEMRIAQILNGVRIFTEHPWGIGNATYPAVAESMGLKFPQGTPPDPHNSYIQVLTGFGLIGLISYMLALAYIPYITLNRTRINSREFRWLAILITFSLYFQGLFIGELLTQPLSWILFGYIFGKLPDPTHRSHN